MRGLIVSLIVVVAAVVAWLAVMGTILKDRSPKGPSAVLVLTLDVGASDVTSGDTLCYLANEIEGGGQVWHLDVPQVTVLDSTGQAYRLPDGRVLEDIPARQLADMEEIPNTTLKMCVVRTQVVVTTNGGSIVRRPPTIVREGFDLGDLVALDRRDRDRRPSALASR